MARRQQRRGRQVNGILLLDKPLGITSNAALQQVKQLYNANKAGHTGNLDPAASGLLPLCFGEATKLSPFLLDADKVYVGTCKLGVRTSTADIEGEVIATAPVPPLDRDQVTTLLQQFLGEQDQIPPMHSAIKHKGQPLYKLAHQGIEIERKPRRINIFALDLLRLEGDELELRVHCSKGTYIRTLAEDIGNALGTGAHLSALHRTAVGPFRDQMITIDTLEACRSEEGTAALDRFLLPMEQALEQMPAVELTETSVFYIRQGQPVLVPQAPTSGWVRLFAAGGRFLGVGSILDDGRVAPKRLIGGAK